MKREFLTTLKNFFNFSIIIRARKICIYYLQNMLLKYAINFPKYAFIFKIIHLLMINGTCIRKQIRKKQLIQDTQYNNLFIQMRNHVILDIFHRNSMPIRP